LSRQTADFSVSETCDGEQAAGFGEGTFLAGRVAAVRRQQLERAGLLPAGAVERTVVLRLAANAGRAGRIEFRRSPAPRKTRPTATPRAPRDEPAFVRAIVSSASPSPRA